MDVPDELRCRGINTGKGPNGGKRCARTARVGDTLCENHLKQRPVVTAAVTPTATPAKVQADALAIVKAAGIEVADDQHLEPVEVMGWVVTSTHWIASALVDRLKSAPDISADGEAAAIRSALEALGHVRKAAEAAESAGMQRRKVVVEEAKIRLLFLALERVIQRMGFSAEVEARFRDVLGEELAATGERAA